MSLKTKDNKRAGLDTCKVTSSTWMFMSPAIRTTEDKNSCKTRRTIDDDREEGF